MGDHHDHRDHEADIINGDTSHKSTASPGAFRRSAPDKRSLRGCALDQGLAWPGG